jgi:UDPglucose 6-dehydrogenase
MALPRARFYVASNPEFLREGTAVTDFLYPDRIVLGVDDDFSAAMLYSIYRPLAEGAYYRKEDAIPCPGRKQDRARVIVTNAKSAELIKHASNAFLAMKISFINMVANISEAVGADIDQVCAGVGSDPRIGPQFLQAGIGYGSSCFAKDISAFHSVAAQCGTDSSLLDEIVRINSEQRQRFVKKVRTALWTLRGKRIGVLGLAFKGGTDDIRESPAIAIVQELLKEGASVCAYDPAAMSKAQAVLPPGTVEYAENEYLAASRRDALLVLTEWEQFAKLDLQKLRSVLKQPIVIDGRNLFQPSQMAAAGFLYYSVGRPLQIADNMPYLWHGIHLAPQPIPVASAHRAGVFA